MLQVRGKKATNIQSSLFFITMDAHEILNCVEQYLFIISEEGWIEIDNTEIFNKYPKLLTATMTSLRYEIIVGLAKLTDSALETICLEKLFNQCEQYKIIDFKSLISKYRNEITKYDYLLNDYIILMLQIMKTHQDLVHNERSPSELSTLHIADTDIYNMSQHQTILSTHYYQSILPGQCILTPWASYMLTFI